MTVAILNVPSKPLSLGQGSALRAMPIGDCTPLSTVPSAASFTIDWVAYGAISSAMFPSVGGTRFPGVVIECDLGTLGAANKIDKLRSVTVDNTFNPTPCYIYFEDTQFTVTCPAYSTTVSPIWTNGLSCKIFATNFADGDIQKSTFQFSSIHVNLYSSIPAPIIENKKTAFLLHSASQINGVAAQVYNNCNFGPSAAATPSGSQYMCCFAMTAATPITVNQVVANGNAGRIMSRNQSSDTFVCSAIVAARSNEAGALRTVTITFSAAPLISALYVIGTYNLVNKNQNGIPVVYDFNGGNTGKFALFTPKIGVAIACVATRSASAAQGLTGIRNVQENFTINGANTLEHDVGFQSTDGSTLNISNVLLASPTLEATSCISLD